VLFIFTPRPIITKPSDFALDGTSTRSKVLKPGKTCELWLSRFQPCPGKKSLPLCKATLPVFYWPSRFRHIVVRINAPERLTGDDTFTRQRNLLTVGKEYCITVCAAHRKPIRRSAFPKLPNRTRRPDTSHWFHIRWRCNTARPLTKLDATVTSSQEARDSPPSVFSTS
jgi:hypothetical protein